MAHREAPLGPEALAARTPIEATERSPHRTQDPTSTTLYYTANRGAMIEPRVRLEPLETPASEATHWRVIVDVDGALAPHALGVRSGPIKRQRMKQGEHALLEGFRPAWQRLTFAPMTGPKRQPRRIAGKKGRSYSPLTVFPDDSRVVLTDTSYPWSCIGRIETSDGDLGSAALVGGRVVVTAQHALPSRTMATGNWWIKFVPAYFDGASKVGLSSYVSDAHWYVRDDTEFNVSHDYAALRLYDPLGSQLGYFGANEFDDDWRNLRVFSGVGYPKDIANNEEPVVQFNWWMADDFEDDDGQILETTASLEHGESGGPFFAWWNNDPRIVGVVSGGGNINGDQANALAGGPNLVDIINWARGAWPV